MPKRYDNSTNIVTTLSLLLSLANQASFVYYPFVSVHVAHLSHYMTISESWQLRDTVCREPGYKTVGLFPCRRGQPATCEPTNPLHATTGT